MRQEVKDEKEKVLAKTLAAAVSAAMMVTGTPVVYGAEFSDGEAEAVLENGVAEDAGNDILEDMISEEEPGSDGSEDVISKAELEDDSAEAASVFEDGAEEELFLDEVEAADAAFTDEADEPMVLTGENEQFKNLEVGETYWFDLSAYADAGATGGQGEVCDGKSGFGYETALTGKIDTSLHWVPFTYAGTMDAYSYEKSIENEVVSKKEGNRSLFIAQYPVKKNINWNSLNTAELIYGTEEEYTSGSISYRLRVLSGGENRRHTDDLDYGTPENNEWDKILDKSEGLIPNCNLFIESWTQDMYNNSENCVVRGYSRARGWHYDGSNDSDKHLGWRPALEILNTGSETVSDNYVTVSLKLNGGVLKFANGDSPDCDELRQAVALGEDDDYTLPIGNENSGNIVKIGADLQETPVVKWLGSDGKLYEPGDSVDMKGSMEFTALYAEPEEREISAPSVAAVDTNSITLNVVTLPTDQDGVVSYAVSESEATEGAYDSLTWKTPEANAAEITIDNLKKGTKYYCYARVSATQKYEEAISKPVTTATEAYATLTVGETYWFDLSAYAEASATGNKGEAWDGKDSSGDETELTRKIDTSLHWVPFTYAGTVDAYSYNNDDENKPGVPIPTGTPRSLFIAQYPVKNNISWKGLNGTNINLIYGTENNYTSEGISYRLRVLSGGNEDRKYGATQYNYGTPENNEWDKILDKREDLIPNCVIYSWAQDIVERDMDGGGRAVRGSSSARFWGYVYFNDDVSGGWRPALEILNTGSETVSDNYVTVGLNLNGGSLGKAEDAYSSDSVNVAVKNGSGYKLPILGQTGEDGNSTVSGAQTVNPPTALADVDRADIELVWKDADGNIYSADEAVTCTSDMSFEALWREKISPFLTVEDGSGTVPYDGNPVAVSVNLPEGYEGTTVYSYAVKTDGTEAADYQEGLPVNVGSYTIKAAAEATENYASWTANADIIITKAENAWTTEPSIESWTYGDSVNAPVGAAKFGSVVFSYSSTPDGAFNEEASALRPGTRYMKAFVEGTDNYSELEKIISFTVRRQYIPPVTTPTPIPSPTPIPIPENFPEGSERNPDGSITTPDGTVVEKDGTITLPDGVVLKPDADGKVPTIDRDNTVTDTNGTIIKKDGTIVLPGEDKDSEEDDTVIEKGDGSRPLYAPEKETVTVSEGNKVTLPFGKEMTPPEGSVVEIDGTITLPDGTVVDPDGTIHKPDGTVIDPDGTTHNPDGSIQSPEGDYLRPATPMLERAEVFATGNQVRAVLSGECAGAVGYDYVISANENCINDKDYLSVSKNILRTNTDFRYIPKGTYYVYCHAWTRGEDGKKVFSKWSNSRTVTVTATTPETPEIVDIKVRGRNVTITYKNCKDAAGYDLVLGSAYKKVYGEKRPVDYGNLVKKVKNGSILTVTFRNVPKGRYFAALHSWNRTSEDHKKVFSPWSETRRIIVK